jgi:hypothetical protein
MTRRAPSPVSFLLLLAAFFLVVGAILWARADDAQAVEFLVLGVLCLIAAPVWHFVARSRPPPRFRDERLDDDRNRDHNTVISGVIVLLAVTVRFAVAGLPGLAIMYIVLAVLGTLVALRMIKSAAIRHRRRRKPDL